MNELDITAISPDQMHKATLKFYGEIRFGPRYYSLIIDSLSFGNRIFGKDFLWSPDSRFFAIQEWKTTDEKKGPQTQLLIVDLHTRHECILARAEKGFIIPKQFDDNKLIYTRGYLGSGVTKELEIEFLSLNRWIETIFKFTGGI